MLYTIESSKNIGEVGMALEEVIKKRKFGVLTVHNLKETLARKGVELNKKCRIFEVCNPLQAKKVLEANAEISAALPCRISVFIESDKTKLLTIKPTVMLSMYSNPELKEIAKKEEHYEKVSCGIVHFITPCICCDCLCTRPWNDGIWSERSTTDGSWDDARDGLL